MYFIIALLLTQSVACSIETSSPYILVDGCPERNPNYDPEADTNPKECRNWDACHWDMGMCPGNNPDRTQRPTPTLRPSKSARNPSATPIGKQTAHPSKAPTGSPSTDEPTQTPTYITTVVSTNINKRTTSPTVVYSGAPSDSPSGIPFVPPPTATPTNQPSNAPSDTPSDTPSDSPTQQPTEYPTWISSSTERCPNAKLVNRTL